MNGTDRLRQTKKSVLMTVVPAFVNKEMISNVASGLLLTSFTTGVVLYEFTGPIPAEDLRNIHNLARRRCLVLRCVGFVSLAKGE